MTLIASAAFQKCGLLSYRTLNKRLSCATNWEAKLAFDPLLGPARHVILGKYGVHVLRFA
jgi:hypothetical protein